MSTDEHLRRLARELVLPDQADAVIQRPKYWSPRFCWLYFERCDELIWEAPEDGLVAAEVCPELVSLTEMKTREPHERLQLHALAALGTAICATGELDQAEEHYRGAFQLAKANRCIMRSDVANLLYRFGYLLCCRDRTASAVKVASQSIELYREASDDIRGRHLGEALLVRGFTHHRDGCLKRAMTDWAEAISCAEVKQTPRVWYTALHNLAVGVMRGGVPARELCQVEGYITRACRSLSKQLLSVPKLKVCWVRAMIQIRFGSTRRGEATYRKTMDGFLKLGEIVDLTLVRVTLGRHLQREGRYEELKTLAVETNELCEQLCPYDEIKRAVFIWKESVVAGTVSVEVFSTTWQVLERRSFERATDLTTDAFHVLYRIGVINRDPSSRDEPETTRASRVEKLPSLACAIIDSD